MRRGILLGALMACCWILTACTTVGNGRMTSISQESTAATLVIGQTTQAEVLKELGEAKVRPYNSGHEVWLYEYSQGLPKFVDYVPLVGLVTSRLDTPRRELRILFDAKGVVKKYVLIEATSQL